MKIASLKLRKFQQFQHLDLDFTDPLTGEPLDRVCFIGPNGTGKTTLLRELRTCAWEAFFPTQALPVGPAEWVGLPFSVTQVRHEQRPVHHLSIPGVAQGPWTTLEMEWERLSVVGLQPDELRSLGDHVLPRGLVAPEAGRDLIIEVPADRSPRLLTDPPRSTLNEALPLAANLPLDHVLAPDNANEFWKLLIALDTRRKGLREEFMKANKQRTYAELEAEFDRTHPEVLSGLAELWDSLLAPAGLELDLSAVKWPSQLNENLAAHIRVKATNAPLSYNALSSGLRSFLFRLGHLYALYFDRDVRHGFLFVDEPENSLHPSFLYGLLDQYTGIIKNTQLFVATHSPIVAAQFRPEERILLNFDDNACVIAERGHAPQGDDPNDVLLDDFRVENILGAAGQTQWQRFVELRGLMLHETDTTKLKAYRDEYLAIGAAYRFNPNALPSQTS